MSNSSLFLRSFAISRQVRSYASKISSDEKLLQSILEDDDDLKSGTTLKTSDETSAGYRKKSKLSTFSIKEGIDDKKDANKVPPIGPRYWREKFKKSYKKVEKGLLSPLDEYVNRNMDVIKSYNKEKKKNIEQRIKVNIKQKLKWNNIFHNSNLHDAIIRYLSSQSISEQKNIELTPFQQRFFALMTGNASTIAKGPSGSGKSFSLLMSALKLHRSSTRGRGINSLILVKSNALVFQHQKTIANIISQMDNQKKHNIKNVAQFLYRGTPDEEMQQEDDLTDFQTPHILISTPQRLLDILSSKGMDFLKINSLAYIGVDDFTSMIDETNLLETEKKAPVVELMNYVLKLQDYRRKHNDPHPQVVLITDNSSSENIILQLKEYTKWIEWNKFAPIGKFGEEEDLPFYKYISDKSFVSTVLVCPRVFPVEKKQSSVNNKYKVTLYDMKPFEYGNIPSIWLETLYKKTFGNPLVYKKHRNSNWTNIPNDVKKGELDILCSGLGKLLKKKEVSSWLGNNRGLVVHPDELNSKQVVEILSAKTGRKVRAFDYSKDSDIFTTKIKGNSDDIKDINNDNNNDNDDNDNSQLLVINSSLLTGLTLRGLSSIFILGINSIKSEAQFATIVGRARDINGLIPNNEFSVFSEKINDNEVPKSRTFIVSAMLPDGSIDPFDRNFLERAFIVNGLVHQIDAIGVREHWSEEKEEEYKKVINGSHYDEGPGIEFNGLNFKEFHE